MEPGDFLIRSRLGRALLFGAAALFVTAFAALAVMSFRGALWPVVRACAAADRLAGRPFPCLEVDLTGGEARGHVLLRPPWSNDLILSPTRRSVGVEDPFLQSGEAPDYFAQAWRARKWIVTPGGGEPARDAIALVANSRAARAQDQLHIHVGCLAPGARRMLAEAAGTLPWDTWRLVGPLSGGWSLWALRVRSTDLSGVRPFRLVRERFGNAVRNPGDLMVAAVGARVAGQDAFLILTNEFGHSRSRRPVGAEALIDLRCRDASEPGARSLASGADGEPPGDAALR